MMGRKRRADRSEILDAVGHVLRDHGLDGLSIDAVARAAGIGKTSVLYDFGSKDALLAAFVERKIKLHSEAVETLRQSREGESDATMRALVGYAQENGCKDDLVSGMMVAAAASGSEHFRAFLSETLTNEIARVEEEAAAPRRALLAYFALHGLFSLECFGFCRIDEDRRRALLADIAALLTGPPSGDAVSGSALFEVS